MKVIGVTTQKGGAGKTTLSLHWAVSAYLEGSKVALVDTDDDQVSATKWAARRQYEDPAVVDASPKELARTKMTLKDVIRGLKGKGYDYVFVDTPPKVQRTTTEVARLVDFCVIPCEASILNFDAIELTVDLLNAVKCPAGFVINKAANDSRAKEAISFAKQFGLPVSSKYVKSRTGLSDSFNDGRAVIELGARYKRDKEEIEDTWKWVKRAVSKHGRATRKVSN